MASVLLRASDCWINLTFLLPLFTHTLLLHPQSPRAREIVFRSYFLQNLISLRPIWLKSENGHHVPRRASSATSSSPSSPSASSTALLLPFPRSAALHMSRSPPAVFAPGSGFWRCLGFFFIRSDTMRKLQAVWKEIVRFDATYLFLLNSWHPVIYSVLPFTSNRNIASQ